MIGDGCDVSAQRAYDQLASLQMRLSGSQGTGQGQEAALAEAVLALELPGTPPTRVVGLVMVFLVEVSPEPLCAPSSE